MQLRVAVNLVQHHIGHSIAAQLDNHPHAVAVGFIANVADAFDALVTDRIGNFLDHRRLVHLIRNLGDDQGFAILAYLLDRYAAAHDHRAAARLIGGANTRAPENEPASGEIGPRHNLVQLRDRDRGVIEIGNTGGNDLAQIVRRDIGRHADGDTARAIDQQIGKARGKHARL